MNRRRRVLTAAADWAHVSVAWARAAVGRSRADGLRCGWLTPVILLPGIWEPWRYLLPLARGLHRAGHPVYPLPSLGFNGTTLEGSVERIRAEIREILGEVEARDAGAFGAQWCGNVRAETTGDGAVAGETTRDVVVGNREACGPPVLVAHSKGGLIGKRLLLDAELGPRLAGMVAVCTPFGGSPLAGSRLAGRVLRRTPLRMFAPGSPDLVWLARQGRVNGRIVSIGAAWDEMIPGGTHLPGARNLSLAAAGHFLPLADAATARVVSAEVERLAAAWRWGA